jgi:ABC-2 type transport system permease protein
MTLPVPIVIAAKDLRQRFRDRSAVVLGFVAPLLIAALMSFAFQGAEQFHATMGVVDHDHGALSSAFRDVLASKGLRSVVTTRSFRDEGAARSALRHRRVAAVFVLPDGFSAAATSATPVPIDVLTSVDLQLAGQVASSVATSFVAQINADRLSVATAVAAGAPASQLAALSARAATLRLPIDVHSGSSGARTLHAVSYYAPGMGIFFMFFAISFAARSYFVEQRSGTLERITAAARPGQVLVGKALSVFVYGTASLATMALVTSLAFGADWGGPLLASALGLSMVSAVVALTALVIVVSRTERQAEGIASIVVFGLALLGGNFVFVSAAPALLRRLALFTPNGWALRGFVDLATGPHRWSAVALPVASIWAFTAVVATTTMVLARLRERV